MMKNVKIKEIKGENIMSETKKILVTDFVKKYNEVKSEDLKNF